MTRLLALALVLLAASPALAHKPGDPPHQTYPMGDLQLESGDVIKDFAISYVTHGTLNARKSNAILMVTALTGNHHRLDFLIGPGKALDTTKYFVIATDAIGNGLTTSPSNSKAPRVHEDLGAGEATDACGRGAGGVDHDGRGDGALRRPHAVNPPALHVDRGHLDALDDARPELARPSREAVGDLGRTGHAVLRAPDGGDEIVHV